MQFAEFVKITAIENKLTINLDVIRILLNVYEIKYVALIFQVNNFKIYIKIFKMCYNLLVME